MPSLPSWLKPADPAQYEAEGLRIGAEDRAASALAQQRAAESARADQELQMRQQQLEQQANQAAQKYQAQQAYAQFIAGGGDPIQGILKFGPAMGAASSIAGASRAQAENQKLTTPPSISMVPGPDGKPVPILQGQGRVIPPSALAAPKEPEQWQETVRQIDGKDVPGQESSRTHRFIPYPASDREGAVSAQTKLQIALASKKKASLEKTIGDEVALLALAKKRAGGKTPTHADLEAVEADLQSQIDDLDNQISDVSGGLSSTKTASNAPKAGDVIKGYRFKGGDPSDKDNWEKE